MHAWLTVWDELHGDGIFQAQLYMLLLSSAVARLRITFSGSGVLLLEIILCTRLAENALVGFLEDP